MQPQSDCSQVILKFIMIKQLNFLRDLRFPSSSFCINKYIRLHGYLIQSEIADCLFFQPISYMIYNRSLVVHISHLFSHMIRNVSQTRVIEKKTKNVYERRRKKLHS